MALAPSITVTQSADCTQLVITDTTTYGAPEEDRVDVLVDFVVTSKKTSGDVVITPSHDNTTVTSITVPNPDDGWVKIQMIITEEAPPNNVLGTLNEDHVLVCLLNKCIEEKRDEWVQNDICGCEDEVLERDIKRINEYKASAEYNANILSNPARSQELIERATDLCV